MEIQVLKKDYVGWLQVKGLSKRSIKNYLFYFDKFFIGSLTQENVYRFLKRYNNGVARAFVRSLLDYLKTISPKDIQTQIKEIEIPKITGRKKRKIPEVITKSELHSLAKSMINKRDKIMLYLTFYGGLRISELIAIKPYDFNWNAWLKDPDQLGRLKITGKGNKQRYVYIMSNLMKMIYHWIKQEISLTQEKNIPLFKIKARRWQNILADHSLNVLKRRINPHLLRHSVGSHLRAKGLDLKEIADFLGHESIQTTQIYLHTNKEDLGKKITDILKE